MFKTIKVLIIESDKYDSLSGCPNAIMKLKIDSNHKKQDVKVFHQKYCDNQNMQGCHSAFYTNLAVIWIHLLTVIEIC